MNVLRSLRVISNLTSNEYLSTNNKNIVGTFRSGYVSNMFALLYCETYSYTRQALRKLYCEDIPEYTNTIKADKEKLTDLQQCIKNSINGLFQLKLTYKNAGYLDTAAEFDTIIDSFAMVEIKKIGLLLNPPPIVKPKLIRQKRIKSTSLTDLERHFGHMLL